ncbi:hypothetical protein [Candidatus Rariloculus sp.]|uniref:hypothetical protein n=1 Tax=Candidatus Rariloculus sp. TaxID=3101265 RepID=UPI003D110E2B
MHRICILLVGLFCLTACTTSEVIVAHSVDLVSSVEAIPEEQLLDVGIVVFDPGVPEGEIGEDELEELLDQGTYVQVRRTEALYMAVELRDTLQTSGHWGGVWVSPNASTAADLNVTAEIQQSDGANVRLLVMAEDAAGRVWLDEPYELETAAGAFNRRRYPDKDPYQDLFNSISNDLAAIRADLSDEEARGIRTVAELRYAAELSPEAFDGYVAEGRRGVFEPVRLPAAEDPTFGRTQQIRQREQLFFDTLNQHYASFSSEAAPTYDSWREYAREEAIAIREITRQSRWQTGLGIASILAAIAYGSNSSNDAYSDYLIQQGITHIGMEMIRSGAIRRQERRLHTETLEELSLSFDEAVEPLVVEIQGTQHRLTGTVEAQYAEWRDLLKQLLASETGFEPENLDVYVEVETQPAEESPSLEVQAPPGEEADAEEAVTDANGGAAS